jgi:hypothetical protein
MSLSDGRLFTVPAARVVDSRNLAFAPDGDACVSCDAMRCDSGRRRWQQRARVADASDGSYVTGAVRAQTGAIFFMGGCPNCSSLCRLAQKSPSRVVAVAQQWPAAYIHLHTRRTHSRP